MCILLNVKATKSFTYYKLKRKLNGTDSKIKIVKIMHTKLN